MIYLEVIGIGLMTSVPLGIDRSLEDRLTAAQKDRRTHTC